MGHVVTSAFPVELLLAGVPDAHGATDGTWGLYAGLADLSGARCAATVDHPDLTTGVLRGARGGTIVLTNHSGATVGAPLHLPRGARDPAVISAAGRSPWDGTNVTLEPYGALVLTWDL